MDVNANDLKAQRIAILLPSLAGGGAERSMLHLAQSFAELGRTVDLLVFKPEGAFVDSVPDSVQLVELKATGDIRGRLMAALADPSGIRTILRPVLLPLKADANLRHIVALKRYLETVRPDVLLSALTYTNLAALWAKQLAGNKTPVVVSERIALSIHLKSQRRNRSWRWRFVLPAVSHSYQAADGIVTVSDGVRRDLVKNAQINEDFAKTIYNPVVDSKLLEFAGQRLEHPWINNSEAPLILGAGRLIPQKDFPTLLRAFSILRARRKARLIILGEGKKRSELESQAQDLGIAGDVEMPGFVENPYQYMANAAVFALTSLYEGLPGVLIQAMACGCPVISTDCPGGSAEILQHGKFGRLVPVGDPEALASAINSVLDAAPDRQLLRQRASVFSVERATQQYIDYLDEIVDKNAAKVA
jgi:glycosyltransferase involved in cell wall biosynthesis